MSIVRLSLIGGRASTCVEFSIYILTRGHIVIEICALKGSEKKQQFMIMKKCTIVHVVFFLMTAFVSEYKSLQAHNFTFFNGFLESHEEAAILKLDSKFRFQIQDLVINLCGIVNVRNRHVTYTYNKAVEYISVDISRTLISRKESWFLNLNSKSTTIIKKEKINRRPD